MKNFVVLSAIGFMLIIGIACSGVVEPGSGDSTRKTSNPDMVDGISEFDLEDKAISFTKENIIDVLKYPEDADFYMLEWRVQRDLEDRQITVFGKVDAKNGFGGVHGYRFKVSYARAPKQWTCYYIHLGDEIMLDSSLNANIRELLHPGSTLIEQQHERAVAMDQIEDNDDRPERSVPEIPTGLVEFSNQQARTWQSVDGQFSTEATLIRFDRDTKIVTLIKIDEQEITIDIDQLSLEGRNHIRGLAREQK